jgi:hypothetical protein
MPVQRFAAFARHRGMVPNDVAGLVLNHCISK